MKKTLSRIFPYLNKMTETTKVIFNPIVELVLYVALLLFSLNSSIGLMLLLSFIFINVKKDVKMAFSDPEDVNYVCKTDKELFAYLAHCCITAFLFAIISFQIFIYISLLFWFYFIIFILMFSRVWKFHGKKRIYLFTIIILATIISFIAAPFARDVIYIFLPF